MARISSFIVLSLVVPCSVLWAQVITPDEPAPSGVFQPPSDVNGSTPVRFIAVDVFIDSGAAPLAAYQFEFSGPTGVSIVGVEGGESNAFRSPPYYDPEALTKGRVIVAAFNTGRDLPTGQTRVARLHLRTEGEPDAQFSVKLIVAGNADGQPIEAKSSVHPVDTGNVGN
jgi:hypothetical protein